MIYELTEMIEDNTHASVLYKDANDKVVCDLGVMVVVNEVEQFDVMYVNAAIDRTNLIDYTEKVGEY